MILFYRNDAKTETLTEKAYSAYGLLHVEKISDFAKSFCFSLGDVYISDGLNLIVSKNNPFSEFLFGTIYRFMTGDFGQASTEIACEDPEAESGTNPRGIYPSEYGDILLKMLPNYLLLQIASEAEE